MLTGIAIFLPFIKIFPLFGEKGNYAPNFAWRCIDMHMCQRCDEQQGKAICLIHGNYYMD